MSIFGAELGDGSLTMIDTKRGELVVYRKNSDYHDFKIRNIFDIVRLRDLLNDAYPPEVVEREKYLRMR